jgi:hypothetical protein
MCFKIEGLMMKRKRMRWRGQTGLTFARIFGTILKEGFGNAVESKKESWL